MADYDNPGTATNRLGTDFWAQRPAAFEEPIALMYANLVAEMRREGNGDAIEAMLIERVAYLYCYIRNREYTTNEDTALTNGFDTDRAFKETMQLWSTMANDLRKARDKEQVLNSYKEKVLNEIGTSVTNALKEMPKAQATIVSRHMAKALDNI